MYIYTVKHNVLLRRPPQEPTPYNAFFFFFQIKEELQLLRLNLEVKNEPKNGNLDLTIYKGQNGKF